MKTNNMNAYNTLDVNAVKVDMESDWAKNVLIPALEEIRRTGEAYAVIKVPLKYINLFRGQRDLKASFSWILKNFDPKRVEVKTLNFRDGYLNSDDGHHTIEALKIMGYEEAWFRLFDNLSVEEEARLFIEQNKGVTRLSPADAFKCAEKLNLEPAKTILEVCEKYDVVVGGKKGSLRNITAPRKLLQIYNDYGKEGVDYALGLIELSGWATSDSKAYIEASLNIGYQAYKLFKNDLVCTVKLVKEMSKFKTSTEFIDAQRKKYNEVSAKHPEDCMRLFVKETVEKLD